MASYSTVSSPYVHLLSHFGVCSLTSFKQFKDFMVQGGDPTGTGRGGTSIYGQKLCVTLNAHCVDVSRI